MKIIVLPSISIIEDPSPKYRELIFSDCMIFKEGNSSKLIVEVE